MHCSLTMLEQCCEGRVHRYMFAPSSSFFFTFLFSSILPPITNSIAIKEDWVALTRKEGGFLICWEDVCLPFDSILYAFLSSIDSQQKQETCRTKGGEVVVAPTRPMFSATKEDLCSHYPVSSIRCIQHPQ